jgi:hypothetical protein
MTEERSKIMDNLIAQDADLIELMASDAACYLYPGEDQQAERAAYARGHAHGTCGLRAAQDREIERLREALGLIIENESADTGYGNSSAKIALAALGDWKSGAGDLGGDHVR